jgi:hypothetical protein
MSDMATRTRSRQRTPKGRHFVPVRDGSPIVMSDPLEVLEAIERLGPDLPFESVAGNLRPILPRRRAMPPGTEAGVTVLRPPGIAVGIGVDIGPAFLHVGEGLLATWQVTAEEALERAIDNVRALSSGGPVTALVQEQVGGVPVRAFQSRGGWASALLLVPDELARRFGPDPCLLAAPMRNLMLAVPIEQDRVVLHWILDEIAAEDPNGLLLPLFSLVGGELRIESTEDDVIVH